MYRGKKISVCMPCRNEADHLGKVLAKVPDFVDEVVIVSNASSDDTVKVAKKLGARAFEDNRTIDGIGYGFAHITAIEQASGDIIVGADGDGTYPVEELASIIDYFLDNAINFLSCNRHPLLGDTKIPFSLRFGVWMLNTEVRLLYGKNIQDILSGMWLLDSKAKDNLNLTMGDWNLSPEIKLSAACNPSLVFDEYHIIQHRRLGSSHQNYFKTGLSHAFWILKNRFFSFRPSMQELPEEQS